MRILVLSDLHGHEKDLNRLSEEAGQADLLVCVGDITHFGDVSQARQAVSELQKLHAQVRSVAGNCDNRQIESYLHGEGIALSSKAEKINGILIAGMSGALPGPVDTPFEISEDEITQHLSQVHSDDSLPLVVVSHQPPYGTVADRAMKLKHVGSRGLQDWMQIHKPLLVLSGHIHESYGHKLSGSTHVINPGAFKDGRYAVVDIDPVHREVSAELKS